MLWRLRLNSSYSPFGTLSILYRGSGSVNKTGYIWPQTTRCASGFIWSQVDHNQMDIDIVQRLWNCWRYTITGENRQAKSEWHNAATCITKYIYTYLYLQPNCLCKLPTLMAVTSNGWMLVYRCLFINMLIIYNSTTKRSTIKSTSIRPKC